MNHKELLKQDWYFQGFNGTPALLNGPVHSMTHEMPDTLGYGYTACITTFEKDVSYYLYGREDLEHILQELLSRYKEDNTYIQYLLDTDTAICERVLAKIRARAEEHPLKDCPTASLGEEYRFYNAAYAELVGVSHVVEGFTLTTENTIRAMVDAAFPDQPDALTILTTPPVHSFISKEHYELAKIARQVLDGKDVQHAITAHTNKYYWKLNNYTTLRTLTEDDFRKEIDELVSRGPDAFDTIIQSYDALPSTLAMREEMMAGISGTELHDYLSINHALFEIHDRRKEHMIQVVEYLDASLREIAKRHHMSLADIRYVLPEEIDSVDEMEEELRLRRAGSVYVWTVDGHTVYTGEEAQAMSEELMKQQDHVQGNELSGNAASSGVARGTVKVCRGIEEISKMKQGDILVACMTQPEFVPAMKIARAVVTDEGGLTCHAAIISRELKIPCVIGTTCATRVLKDGMEVTVDADNGVVIIHE